MRFYKNQHQFYIGIDLHARTMYICVINRDGQTVFHKNMECSTDNLKLVTNTFGNDIIIGVECIFTWYQIADFCAERGIDFALDHALYMKAIHGGKTKSDKIDSEKIANILRGGMIPIAYAYPKEKRAVRDLLQRRLYFVRQRAELFMFQSYHDIITKLEFQIEDCIEIQDPYSLTLLRSIPGLGLILPLTILYETDSISRFSDVGKFISYCRLVKCLYNCLSFCYHLTLASGLTGYR